MFMLHIHDSSLKKQLQVTVFWTLHYTFKGNFIVLVSSNYYRQCTLSREIMLYRTIMYITHIQKSYFREGISIIFPKSML